MNPQISGPSWSLFWWHQILEPWPYPGRGVCFPSSTALSSPLPARGGDIYRPPLMVAYPCRIEAEKQMGDCRSSASRGKWEGTRFLVGMKPVCWASVHVLGPFLIHYSLLYIIHYEEDT